MFAWGLRHVNVYTVAAGGEGRRQGPKRQLTLTRVDVTKVYYKISDFERFALSTQPREQTHCVSHCIWYSTLLLGSM